VARLRHARAIDQYRDHANITSERSRNFDGNEIVRSLKPAVTLLVSGIQPVGTDNGYEDITRSNLIVEVIREVDPGWNVVHIHEKILPSKSLGKSIVQPTGHAHGIVSAVINEDHLTTLRLTL
jgi:hypothetical protein